ncbi:ABC transporter substrate-binding protein [Nocardioides panacihumi]|uniref:ABC transporter substrate-binding protein n=1 Tax=Nocardioides panacihumi TaxID=400774 RepID=A0ABN2QS05_9ACTN
MIVRPRSSTGRRRTGALAAAALTLLAPALASCGDSAGDGNADKASGGGSGHQVSITGVGTVEPSADLSGKLPSDVAADKVVKMATNAPYAPFIDFSAEGDTSHFKGLDYDLVQAIAARLGIEAQFQQQPFDGLVPGLQAGKYDAIVGGITDNFERQATATFVDYTASGTGVLVPDGNPDGIATLADLCGKKVAVQKASKQVELMTRFNKSDCGSSPIELTEYPQNTDAVQALMAKKAAAMVATKVNLVDAAAKLDGKVEVVDDPSAPNGYHASPNGIGFDKGDAALAEAFQAALQSLIDDGTYGKILAKWKQEPIGIDKATIDAAID